MMVDAVLNAVVDYSIYTLSWSRLQVSSARDTFIQPALKSLLILILLLARASNLSNGERRLFLVIVAACSLRRDTTSRHLHVLKRGVSDGVMRYVSRPLIWRYRFTPECLFQRSLGETEQDLT